MDISSEAGYLMEMGLARLFTKALTVSESSVTEAYAFGFDEPFVVRAIRNSTLWGEMQKNMYERIRSSIQNASAGYLAEGAIACNMYAHFGTYNGPDVQEDSKWKNRILTELTEIKLFQGQAASEVFSRKYRLYEPELVNGPLVVNETQGYDLLEFVMGNTDMSRPLFLNPSLQEGPDLVFFLQSEDVSQPLLPVLVQSRMRARMEYKSAWETISRRAVLKRLTKCLEAQEEYWKKKIQESADEGLEEQWKDAKAKRLKEIDFWDTRPLVRLLVMGAKYNQSRKDTAQDNQSKKDITLELEKESELMGVVDSETMSSMMGQLGASTSRARESKYLTHDPKHA